MARVNALLLAAYVAVPALAWWRVRSLAWVVIAIAGSAAVFGAGINFVIDRGIDLTRVHLQVLLLVLLFLVGLAAFLTRYRGRMRMSRQALRTLLPIVVLLVLFLIITMRWTEEFAFLRPVSFLIGNGEAEDNAKWLDFTAQWARGEGIEQPVPMGGPLQLYMTFIGTVMSVISQIALGGVNEVAVAANAVVYGEFMLVILMPLAFATLAEVKFAARRRSSEGRAKKAYIPLPAVWLGMLTLSVAALAVIAYGHLTLQFTFLVGGLWAATFLAGSRIPRARLLTSLAAAASMTVWLPLNVIAIIIIGAWIVVFVGRAIKGGLGAMDWLGAAVLALVAVGVFQPVYSSMDYLIFGSAAALAPMGLGGSLPMSGGLPALADSILFAATGGTESAGPILVLAAAASAIAASLVVTWQPTRRRCEPYVRFAPLGAFAGIAVAIFVLDLWSTGDGPHYGSLKFSFMTAALALAVTLPIALLALDPHRAGAMTASRWIGVGGVLVLLSVDTVLPRAIAEARPTAWSPPIPFENPSSYWWPAEVNGTAVQPIIGNPIACMYLPEGSPVPTAIVPSGLSDPQRVYACTRQLSGLGGLDAQAQPIVDWLRREWFTNTPAWSPVYDAFAALPDEVLDRPVILLDDGSNVRGIETLRSLLARYPKEAANG